MSLSQCLYLFIYFSTWDVEPQTTTVVEPSQVQEQWRGGGQFTVNTQHHSYSHTGMGDTVVLCMKYVCVCLLRSACFCLCHHIAKKATINVLKCFYSLQRSELSSCVDVCVYYVVSPFGPKLSGIVHNTGQKLANFLFKAQIINILGFVGYTSLFKCS